MQSISEWHTAPDGAEVETGTIIHEGRSYSALGAVICGDLLAGYVERGDKPKEYWFTTWGGTKILRLWSTGFSMGFGWTRIECFQSVHPFKGRFWFGRGLGAGCFIRLRPGRRAR